MNEIFNLWDLEGVHIRINQNFLNKINKEIFTRYGNKRKAYNSIFKDEISFPVYKNMLKSSYYKRWFVPLNFLVKISEVLDIPKEELQDNVISYKSANSVNSVILPKLPIKITPVFDMIYAHNIGDGTVSVAEGRLPYFAYRQFNSFYRESYIKKIENIFGCILFKKQEFKDFTRVRCPSALSSLFFKYYSVDNRGFLSDKARISERIFMKGKESMIAVLAGFIIDEGHIDSTQITIVLKNKLLIEDLKKMCDLLGYKSKIYIKKGDYEGLVELGILRDGMKKFYSDYLELHKEYPLIDLGFKGKNIENSFKISERPICNIKGNENLIYSILSTEPLSVNQLSGKILMTRQGVRYHIHNLLNKGKIRLLSKTKLNFIYGV